MVFLTTFFFFLKFLADTCPFFGGHWYPCFGFLVTSPLGFKARVGSALYAIFAEANVMYIPQDSPLVLHLPTSWRPARSRSLPHMHVQRWDLAQISNVQPHKQKTNALPLCQRPGSVFLTTYSGYFESFQKYLAILTDQMCFQYINNISLPINTSLFVTMQKILSIKLLTQYHVNLFVEDSSGTPDTYWTGYLENGYSLYVPESTMTLRYGGPQGISTAPGFQLLYYPADPGWIILFSLNRNIKKLLIITNILTENIFYSNYSKLLFVIFQDYILQHAHLDPPAK